MNANARRIWGTFVCYFTWYQVVLYNFTYSPLRDLAEANAGVDAGLLLMLVNLALAVSAIVAFFVVKGWDIQRHRVVWSALHGLSLVVLGLIPWMTSATAVYALIIAFGLFSGIVFYRVMYCCFFHVPRIGWPRMVAVLYMMINGCIHLFALAHGRVDPRIMYALAMCFLLAGTIFSMRYGGSTIEIRSILPEYRFSAENVLPMALLIVGIQICYAAYKTLVLPVMPSDLSTELYQTAVNAAALLLLFAYGKRIRERVYLKLFLALVAGAFISFQVMGAGGRNVVETFMQPAYYCWDVLLFCYLCNLFHRYGKHHMRLQSALLLFFLAMALSETLATHLFSRYLAFSIHNFGLIYIVVFGLMMLVPWVERVLDSFGGDAEPRPADDTCPCEAEPASRMREAEAEARLPRLQGPEKLTARELDVLRHLAQRQDADVISHLLGISQSTVRTHIRHILDKYGVATRAELLALADIPDRPRTFSAREAEVLRLMGDGFDDAQIAAKLYISTTTVRTHIHNMCAKCGAGSRKELAVLKPEQAMSMGQAGLNEDGGVRTR